MVNLSGSYIIQNNDRIEQEERVIADPKIKNRGQMMKNPNTEKILIS